MIIALRNTVRTTILPSSVLKEHCILYRPRKEINTFSQLSDLGIFILAFSFFFVFYGDNLNTEFNT